MTDITSQAPRDDFESFLVAMPEEMALGQEEPPVIVDRYYSPDFEQQNDGILMTRETLIQHARPVRKNVVSLHTEVHDVLLSDGKFAARYTMTSEMRKGETLVNEIYMFGTFAPDGRIQRITSTSRTVSED